jgi:hypothetical protein
MKTQLDNGYAIDEDGILVDMWDHPVCREIIHTLGHEWEPQQEHARTEYLKSHIARYREFESDRTPEENKQIIFMFRYDVFSKSELLDLYQNGKYLP